MAKKPAKPSPARQSPAERYAMVRERHSEYYTSTVDKRKEVGELVKIVGDAFRFWPPLYPNSLIGLPNTWFPRDRYSELSILNPLALGRAIQYLLDITVPASPVSPPSSLGLIEETLFWRPTQILFRPDHNDNPYSFPDEAWIYINGVATDPGMADIHADLLVSMFHRPLTIVQNATDSIAVDLVESVIGKAWETMTEVSAKAYPFVLNALHDKKKKRVVVICHSQGTIIMANVLRALLSHEFRAWMLEGRELKDQVSDYSEEEDLHNIDLLCKLEIYAFANAADVMVYAPPDCKTEKGHRIPWIENFGNEYDLVARTGMLAPHKEKHNICIDGTNFVRKNGWGHFLSEHYLRPIRRHLKNPGKVKNPFPAENGSGPPRLYEYYKGARPEHY